MFVLLNSIFLFFAISVFIYDFLGIINFYMFYTFVILICIYIADHRFISAVTSVLN